MEILSAQKKKKRSSHTWKAILVGRQALDLGLIMRIGDGSTTSIWEDRSIPDGNGNKTVCKIASTTTMIVNELICDDSRSWDIEAFHANMVQADIEAVF
jgi:hypothetical protein